METKRFSLVKPSVNTPFHIDFSWWKQHDSNWRVDLMSCLCDVHQKSLGGINPDEPIDWIDPETAEVQQVDALQHVLITHCARQEGFLTDHTAIVDAVFRILLANGNTPTSMVDLGAQLNRPPETLLRTFSTTVYKGIRPCQS